MALNSHGTELFFHTPVLANKWCFLVHSTSRYAPYIHPSHDSTLELWQTFQNVVPRSLFSNALTKVNLCLF